MSKHKILPDWFPEMMDEILVEKDKGRLIKWHELNKEGVRSMLGIVENEYIPNISDFLDNYMYNEHLNRDIPPAIRNLVHVANYCMMIADKLRKEIEENEK